MPASRTSSLRKTWVIALREYSAAVRTKAFLVSIVFLPLMMSGGFFAQKAMERIGDSSTKKVLVLDRSPGETIFATLAEAADARNKKDIFEPRTGKQIRPKFAFEKVALADGGPAAIDAQRLGLSEKVRREEAFAYIEIGKDILHPTFNPTTQGLNAATQSTNFTDEQMLELGEQLLGDENLIRYTSAHPTYYELRTFITGAIVRPVYFKRLLAAGFPALKVMPLLIPPQVTNRGLASQAKDGSVTFEPRQGELALLFVPLALMLLLFVVVMVGASPLTTNVIEEKQLRIAEVLLGSVDPFQLMLGKLLGGVAVALTLAFVYVGGAYWLATQYDVARYVSFHLLAWFVLFTVVATLMYGSVFVAAGAAVTNIKEAQSLIAPVMIFITLPLFVVGPMIQDPAGPLPTIATFFPLSAPIITVARIAIPPGLPAWQILISVAISLVTTCVLVFAAGRVFRLGFLVQGQPVRFGQLVKWVIKG